jgi:drug/metabolite transporter (DMT)-like permease
VRLDQRINRPVLASVSVVVSATLWGLFWIPLRAIEQAGVAALWTGPLLFLLAALMLMPFAVMRWRNFRLAGSGLILTGLLPGTAFALYAVSLNLTDVVHALLLFYLSPIWSTLLGLAFLGERLNASRVAALCLGLSGLAVVLGNGLFLPWPNNMGDWFALISGLCWSLASLRLFRGGNSQIFEKTFAFVVGSIVAGSVLAILPFGLENSLPDVESLKQGWTWTAAAAAVLLPVLWLTIWPTALLSPARIGILFMTEAVVGIGSAAWLTDEPFGAREIGGTTLIVAAGLVEVLPRRRPRPNAVA